MADKSFHNEETIDTVQRVNGSSYFISSGDVLRAVLNVTDEMRNMREWYEEFPEAESERDQLGHEFVLLDKGLHLCFSVLQLTVADIIVAELLSMTTIL